MSTGKDRRKKLQGIFVLASAAFLSHLTFELWLKIGDFVVIPIDDLLDNDRARERSFQRSSSKSSNDLANNHWLVALPFIIKPNPNQQGPKGLERLSSYSRTMVKR